MIAQLLLRTGVAILAGVLVSLVFMALVLAAQYIESVTGISGLLWVFIGGAVTAAVWIYDALT